jgi:hypothetical protein
MIGGAFCAGESDTRREFTRTPSSVTNFRRSESAPAVAALRTAESRPAYQVDTETAPPFLSPVLTVIRERAPFRAADLSPNEWARQVPQLGRCVTRFRVRSFDTIVSVLSTR